MRSNSNIFFNILKNGNIDFVALAMTPWHAIGIEAFLFEKSNEYNRCITGLVMIIPNNDKYVLHENNFSSKNFADVDFFYIENLSNQNFANNIYNVLSEGFDIIRGLNNCRKNENNKKKLNLISPWTPYLPFIEYFKDETISNKYKPNFVVVDEGLGIYLSKKSQKMGIKHASKFSRLAEIKLKIYKYADKFLGKISTRYIELEKRFIYEFETSLKKKENIINLYKKIIEFKSADLEIDADNVALIITEPLPEYNIVSEKQEYNILKEILQIFHDNNIKLLIKPHPYEDKDKYDFLKKDNVNIIKNNIPVEEILTNINPICVIGTISTVLVNSKLIFDIKTISLVNLLKIDDELIEHTTNEFKGLTEDFIHFPDSIDEIINLLNLNTNQKHKNA